MPAQSLQILHWCSIFLWAFQHSWQNGDLGLHWGKLSRKLKKQLGKVQIIADIILFPCVCFAILLELPNQSGVEGYIPLFGIDSNCIWLSCNAGEEPGAVGSLQLSHIDGVPEAGPVSCVVAEPMHSGMISPVNIPSHPVHSNAPGPFELWTLKKTRWCSHFCGNGLSKQLHSHRFV